MKKIIISLLLINSGMLLAQNYQEEFKELLSKDDTLAQEKLLQQWKKASPNDPELYVARFNFYVRKSQKEVVRIDQTAPEGKEVLTIQSNDSTKEEAVGYMFSDTYYIPEVIGKGFACIDSAIKKFPTRLDMRFGKIYMLGQVRDYKLFTDEIIKAIDYSAKIKNAWLWTDNKAQENPKEFFLGSIQDYQLDLYNTGKDALLDNMKKIAEAMLKNYPDHVESLSNIAITYLVKKDFPSALKYLLKAEKTAPTDYVVLSNIAYCYMQTGDKVNAIKYYELTEKHGDDQAKEFAKQKIAELKK